MVAVYSLLYSHHAGVMELVDVVDSKSTAGDSVPVRVRPPAPRRSKLYIACSDFFTKSQSALIPLLLLSKSNPLCWVSIWAQRALSINTRHLDNVPFGTKPCVASFLSRTERFFVSTGKPARLLSGCFLLAPTNFLAFITTNVNQGLRFGSPLSYFNTAPR